MSSKSVNISTIHYSVASFSVNDRLNATWYSRNQRFAEILGDFGDPNVCDSLLQVLST